jgi:hypothetical protein
MPLGPTPAQFKSSEQACDQWHSSQASTFLPVHTVNFVQTLKDTTSSYTRDGLLLQHAAYKGQLSLIVNVHNYVGGVSVSGLQIRNATIGMMSSGTIPAICGPGLIRHRPTLLSKELA